MSSGTIVALAGGVGGAKLAHGLARLIGPRLTVVGNTGDDFEHLGFAISPDLDTVMYTLAGVADFERGWGLAGETWQFVEQVGRLGGPDWFRLGDRDLATHAIRTQRLRAGVPLSEVTADLCRALGVAARVLPMSDQPVRTLVHTGGRTLPFQEYFVRLRCEPQVTGLSWQGADAARLNPAIDAMRGTAAPEAIILCPSNPYLSIDPILAVPGMREWIAASGAPVIAVSPIVGGAAIKGPAAKIMRELGLPVTAAAVARHYRGLISGFVIDTADAGLHDEIAVEGLAVQVVPTVMLTLEDRVQLARDCLAFAETLKSTPLVPAKAGTQSRPAR